ncbi:acyltransferase family protein [Geodermatophilus arenarius]|uniref:Acyltransferase family protein n=1 Tax=Geodermatophilus arenarius TaxID=1137990 RepID=A0ABV9LJ26_9ACTN
MSRGLDNFPNRHNSLNAIRLGLATAVIVSHSWPIGGYGDDPQLGQLTLGRLAVAGFFAISGWLITQSRESTPLPSYLWRRFLRIYPGFLASLIVVAFVFAPVGSALDAGSWAFSDGVAFVGKNLAVHMSQFNVGATPSGVPYPGNWNSSLWTLFYEVLCYLLIGLCITAVPGRWLATVVVTLWLGATALQVGTNLGGTVAVFLELAPYFLAGATLYVLRQWIPLHWSLGLVSAVITTIMIAVGAAPALAALPLAYLMLWLGAALPLHLVGRRNDISYGMYVYAFPVQQLLVLAGAGAWSVGWFVLASTACTVPLAVASWFLIERPAQRYRRAADNLWAARRITSSR